MNYEKYIIDSILDMSGSYTPYQIFTDWISMMALSIHNSCKVFHDEIYTEREKMYLDIAKKYSTEHLKTMGDMLGALTICLEEKFGDILGDIYMKAGCGNKNTGQFFTPYHLSYLTANMIYGSQFSHFNKNEQIEINEPSTGGGGMMIAICQVAKENGINYQKNFHIVAQDLDWNGVYMTYVQLSLLGVRAVVVQGDTLREPYRTGYDERRVFRTPAELGAIL